MIKMIIVIKNQLKELNQQYKKLLVKTLLALLLLIPSLSWGFFGKKYNCEPADDEFFYMSNYVESLGPHILKISGSKDKLTINFSDGNTDELDLIQKNHDVLTYLYDQDIQIIIFLPLNENINIVWDYPRESLQAWFNCSK